MMPKTRTTVMGFLLVGMFPIWVSAANPCQECHEEQVAAAKRGPHAQVVSQDEAFCSACHGPGANHMESGEAKDIVGKDNLASWVTSQQSQACLSCHKSQFPRWTAAAHPRVEVSCWNCHGNTWHIAKAPVADRGRGLLCGGCHSQEQGEFARAYHHPLSHGRMGCGDCHQLHGPQERQELAVDTCLRCHGEVAGPYVFPHRAVEEGCTSCHQPHGAVNRSLLVSSGNALCLTCHLQSNFPGVGKVPHNYQLAGGARCFDCHTDVHGSNASPRLASR
ncbi:MAG: cytochrome c3 family protein [Thermoanaerobaculaceae bacterium]